MYTIRSETFIEIDSLQHILKFQDKPILRTCQKSTLQNSLFDVMLILT